MTKFGRVDVKETVLEMAALSFMLLCVLMPFFEPLCQGQGLSRLSLVKEVDQVQNPSSKPFNISLDPSASLIHVPNEIFASKQGVDFPLWNPVVGAGRPFIGDFQTLMFSFLHRIFPISSPQLYNLGILFKIACAALGLYVLARCLGLSPIAAAAAGQAFALCPRCLRFAELCGNYFFYPWLIVAALWLARRPSISSTILLAAIFSSAAYNMHPETFACAAVAAMVLAIAQRLGPGCFSMSELKRTFFWSAAVTMLTILFTAPIVFPFVEFVQNGESYKFFVSGGIDYIKLPEFLQNTVSAFAVGSTHTGLVLGVLAPLGFVAFWNRNKSVVLIFLVALLFSTRPGFLESALALKPVSYLLPEYTAYIAIMFMALAGGCGLDSLLLFRTVVIRWRFVATLAFSVLAVLVLACHTDQFCEWFSDKTSFAYRFNHHEILSLNFVLAESSILLALILSSKLKLHHLKSPWSFVLGFLIVIANILPLATSTERELPAEPWFWYKGSPLISSLRKNLDGKPYRFVATSFDNLQPNTNMVFGLNDFRSTAPLHPSRYSHYIKLCGVNSRFCNIYETPKTLNHLFDLSSVKYVVSKYPIQSESNKFGSSGAIQCLEFRGPLKVRPGLRVESAKFDYFPTDSKIMGSVMLAIHTQAMHLYSFQIILYDEHRKPIWRSNWQSDSIEKSALRLKNHRYELPVAIPVPSAPASQFLTVALVLRNGFSELTYWPDKEIELSTVRTQSSATLPNDGRFVRISEFADGSSLYENRSVLPRAYLVHAIKQVVGEKASQEALLVRDVDWQHSAVLETSSGESVKIPKTFEPQKPETVRILDEGADNVLLQVRATADCYAVLTDTFYPGWTAYVDGKSERIYPANLAFRAVFVPKGTHYLLFAYDPASFAWGCRLFLLALGLSCVGLVFDGYRLNRKYRLSPLGLGRLHKRETLEKSAL